MVYCSLIVNADHCGVYIFTHFHILIIAYYFYIMDIH